MSSRGIQLVGWCLLFVLVVGCRGCDDPNKDAKKKDEELKKKQRLVAERTATIPSESGLVVSYVKPGHWYQANSRLTANLQDESITVDLTVMDRLGKNASSFPNSPPMVFQRGVSIARGQQKNVSLTYFQPDIDLTKEGEMDFSKETTPAQIKLNYSVRGIGTPLLQELSPLSLLQGYQYSIVTLNSDPARYAYFNALDCMSWPSKSRMPDERITPHRVFDLREDEIATQFPNRFYAMTSISHLVINDGSPSVFSPEQQQTIIDWLHFGGTIIVNGVEAIGGVTNSFLKDYIPLTNTQTATWDETDSDRLNSRWLVKTYGESKPVEFHAKGNVPKLTGELAPESSWIESLEGIVAERFVGQGRIVMTTFPMSNISFLRWPSYSSLVHGALLRKPSRDVAPNAKEHNALDSLFANQTYRGSELNPLHSTRFRLWARDLDPSLTLRRSLNQNLTEDLGPNVPTYPIFHHGKRTSLGAWNAKSTILACARESLQESSGITVPKIKTIIMLLLGYLAVLVPLNWLVFRVIGRLELAWVAAPLIAIVGAFVVARSVQLDVGFSRSQTSYGFVECHSGYSRGVLTNYLALYTSLSTNYEALFAEDQGIVTPLPQVQSEPSAKRRSSLSSYEYSFAGDDGAGLRRTPVLSNTTGLLQSEELIDLGGTVSASFNEGWTEVEVRHSFGIEVHDIGILGINREGQLVKGWLGTPKSGSAVTCKLTVPERFEPWFSQWDDTPALSKPNAKKDDGSKWTTIRLDGDLYVGRLLEDFVNSYPLSNGEFIAIGWTKDALTKLKISPETSQTRHKSLIFMHLRYPDLPTPAPDLALFPKIENEEEKPAGELLELDKAESKL